MPTKPLDRLLFAQGSRCFFCDDPLPKGQASVEHLLASSKGGSNADENCVACCKAVNSLFGSMTIKEKFQVLLRQKGQFRCPNKLGPVASELAPVTDTPGYKRAHDNLKARGSSRPRLVSTLESTVSSVLKGFSSKDIQAVLEALQTNGVVQVNDKKVTYRF
ncbi:MAG: HNH endonuclease [Gammaproteobacteria bacterium]